MNNRQKQLALAIACWYADKRDGSINGIERFIHTWSSLESAEYPGDLTDRPTIDELRGYSRQDRLDMRRRLAKDIVRGDKEFLIRVIRRLLLEVAPGRTRAQVNAAIRGWVNECIFSRDTDDTKDEDWIEVTINND